MVPAGTPKYWFLDKRIWAKKKPIPRPTDCYLDCERRRYFEKIANTLAFWRQKRQKQLNSYGFSCILCQELGFVRGSAPGEGPGQLPEPPPDLPESLRGSLPPPKSLKTDEKSMKTSENQ